jgi:hypothetical protein
LEHKHQRVVVVVRLFVSLQGGRAISVISVQKKKKKDGRCSETMDTNGNSQLQLRRHNAGPADYSCSRKKMRKSA